MIQLTKVMNAVPRRMKTLGSGFALGGLMLLAIGCEFTNAEEARGALQDVREVRQVQDFEITPRLDRLEALRQDEVLPREQQIAEGEAAFQTRIANLEEDIAWFLAEIDRLQNGLVNGEGELQEKHRIISDIQSKLDHLNANGPQMDDLYQLREEIKRKLAGVEPVDVATLKEKLASIQDQIARVEGAFEEKTPNTRQEIAFLESDLDRLHHSVEEHELDLYAKQDMVNDLWNKMNTTDNRGGECPEQPLRRP
jgi:chromosome segregation ATPase